MIQATIRSDDGVVSVSFDATPWFEQASDDDIIELARCGWGGDYPADEVSQYFSGGVTGRVFDYLETHPLRDTNKAIGHETRIDADEAIEWIIEYRRQVASTLGGAWSPRR